MGYICLFKTNKSASKTIMLFIKINQDIVAEFILTIKQCIINKNMFDFCRSYIRLNHTILDN